MFLEFSTHCALFTIFSKKKIKKTTGRWKRQDSLEVKDCASLLRMMDPQPVPPIFGMKSIYTITSNAKLSSKLQVWTSNTNL
jgi:hypothetical protein